MFIWNYKNYCLPLYYKNMNKEQQELLDEAYENYLQHYHDEYNEEQKKIQKNPLHWMEIEYTNIRPYPKESFINKCKSDTEFSQKWGLQIEERELSRVERNRYVFENVPMESNMFNGFFASGVQMISDEDFNIVFSNIPTRLITITYQTKTIESYE